MVNIKRCIRLVVLLATVMFFCIYTQGGNDSKTKDVTSYIDIEQNKDDDTIFIINCGVYHMCSTAKTNISYCYVDCDCSHCIILPGNNIKIAEYNVYGEASAVFKMSQTLQELRRYSFVLDDILKEEDGISLYTVGAE